MSNDEIKKMLLEIQDTSIEFSVTLSGKESSKVNGLYKPETHEIILHNKNFQTDNQLIYTAIHEYTHHVITEKKLEQTGGLELCKSRVHTNEFWAKFHELLEIAEQKGFYVIGMEENPALAQLTEDIKKNYLEKNGQIMLEFGKKLAEAHKLCLEANIRYEDYIDRILRLPRDAAKSITKISTDNLNPSLGYDNMKMISAIANPAKREEAQTQILQGKSPDTVRQMMKKKVENIDVKTRLEKEKSRLEKTINQLTSRLEQVEETLSNL